MNPLTQYQKHLSRRHFLAGASSGIGSLALGTMLMPGLENSAALASEAVKGLPHFAPQAKRVICLFQSGGASHIDMFDDKPTQVSRCAESGNLRRLATYNQYAAASAGDAQ